VDVYVLDGSASPRVERHSNNEINRTMWRGSGFAMLDAEMLMSAKIDGRDYLKDQIDRTLDG
jgi:hypothetical protein